MNPSSDKPWNEQQWERFIQRSEARSARFEELLETLMYHPDRETLIAKEMGWDHLLNNVSINRFGEDEDEPMVGPNPDDASVFRLSTDDDGEDAEMDCFAEHDASALYRLAHEVGLEAHRALQPYLVQQDVDAEDECAEQLSSAYIKSLIPAAKIAGAYGIGCDDEALCGHIVCLRRALAASVTCRAAIAWLQQHSSLPKELLSRVHERASVVSEAIQQRITELRSRVWWD